MKKTFKKRKSIIALVIVGLVIIVAVSASLLAASDKTKKDNKETAKKTEEKITAITAPGIIQDEEYKGLSFTNTTLIKKGNIYTLSMNVTNKTKETSEITKVYIPVKTENGDVITNFVGYIGEDLKAGETRTITASTSGDLSKVVKKEITEKKE